DWRCGTEQSRSRPAPAWSSRELSSALGPRAGGCSAIVAPYLAPASAGAKPGVYGRQNRLVFHRVGGETWAGVSGNEVAGEGEGMGNVSIRRWISVLAFVAVTATLLSSCSESLPLNQLPDITKLPQKVLGKDEQQGKVNEMINRGQ